MNKLHIMVTGANGQVGKELRELACRVEDADFTFLSREDLPIENFELVRTLFSIRRPDVLINCAAYTAVDKAEAEKDLAFLINAEAVGVLAAICRAYQCRFIHISTDYVFDGTSRVPYKETDHTEPINMYGASKLEGEEQAFRANPDSIVVRTSWVYSVFGKNFVKTMVRLMGERSELSVVDDQLGSPTYAADLALALLQIAGAKQVPGGIYHYSNGGTISWYQFAQAIAEMTHAVCRIKPIPTIDFPTPARRPEYSVLDTSKIREYLHVEIQPWRKSLKLMLERLKATR